MPIAPELAQYITQARASGMPDDAIRTELLKIGWKIKDVNEAIPPKIPNFAPPHASPPAQQTPFVLQTKSAQPVQVAMRRNRAAYLIGAALLLVVAAAAGYYFFPNATAVVLKLIGQQESAAPTENVPVDTTFVNPFEPENFAIPMATSTESWQTYRNEEYGVAFKYPATILNMSAKAPDGGAVLDIANIDQVQTTIQSASISMLAYPQTCDKVTIGPYWLDVNPDANQAFSADNGITFKYSSSGDSGMGQYRVYKNYYYERKGFCYVGRLFMYYTRAEYSPTDQHSLTQDEVAVISANNERLIGRFTETTKQILSTLSFTEPRISLAPPNSAPVIQTSSFRSATQEQALQFVVSATDADNDALTYSMSNLPSGASFNAQTKVFSWTPSSSQSGLNTVTLTVSDGKTSVSKSIIITTTVPVVNPDPVVVLQNHNPQFTNIPSQSVESGNGLQFSISATDSDNDALTYSASGLPPGAVFFESTKSFSWTPASDQTGSYSVVFSASDGKGGSASQTVSVEVTAPSLANHNPQFVGSTLQSVTAGQALSFQVSATDSDNDALTYSASGLPPGATFSSASRTFAWSPAINQTGPYSVVFSASDGKGGSASQTISVTVIPPTSASLSPPTALTATFATTTTNGITSLSWYASGASVSGYHVFRNGKLITSNPTLTYQDTGQDIGPFHPGSPYCYTVTAYTSTQESSATAQACITVPSGAIPAPTDLAASPVSSNTMQLTWQYPITLLQGLANKEFFRFDFDRSTNGTDWAVVGYVTNASVNTKSDFYNTVPGATYYYRLFAFSNKRGYSVASNITNATLPSLVTVPNAPTNLTASIGSLISLTDPPDNILSWQDNSNDEDGFTVELYDPVHNTWSTLSSRQINMNTFYHSDTSWGTSYTYRVRAYNSAGSSEPSNSATATMPPVPPPLVWTTPVPSQHVLVVYNEDLQDSINLKDYYLEHRPGLSGANVLGVHTSTSLEDIDVSSFYSTIRDPIVDWLKANQSKPIRYIIMMYGMPSRTLLIMKDLSRSVDFHISVSLQQLGDRSGVPYGLGVRPSGDSYTTFPTPCCTHFMPDTYAGTTALVSRIDMGSASSTEAYIDKLAAAGSGLILSGQSADVVGSTYYFDDVHDSYTNTFGKDAQDAVKQENPSVPVIYQDSSHISNASDVRGYMSWGSNGGLGMNYANDYKVMFSGKSSWYIIQTIESWNGQRFNTGWPGGTGQGNFVDWFASNAFGSPVDTEPYKNTPVGAVVHVSEPGIAGINTADYFRLWERGYYFIEAAWASGRTPNLMVIGDPFVTK